MEIRKVLKMNVGLVNVKDFGSAPDNFIIITSGLDEVNELALVQSLNELVFRGYVELKQLNS